MQVKIRNKTAVIEFENNAEGFGHQEIMKEIIKLLDDNFKKFIFDFKWVTISFNSAISGFLVVTIRNLIESGASIVITNISERDKDLLTLVGLGDLDIKYEDVK